MDYTWYDGAWFGTSDRTMPTGIGQDGVPLIQMDTGKVFFWDEGTQDWIEQ